MDVKKGSGMIDFMSVASLVTTAMILHNNRLFNFLYRLLFLPLCFCIFFQDRWILSCM